MSDQKTCKELVRAEFKKEMRTVSKLWTQYKHNPDFDHPDGTWQEYGLAFDYVAPGTFVGQRRGYWRYQISWGGPSDEFRFYADENLGLTRVEYWYLDWFDGAHVTASGKDRLLWDEIWADWLECDLQRSKLDEAMKDV